MRDKIITQYIADMPEQRREKAARLHSLVLQLFPEVQLSMQYKMPTYHLNDNFFAWGNKKSYFSVYTCSRERIADFKQRHPEIPGGVGCINFRDKDDFPIASLKKVIRNALAPGKKILKREQSAATAKKRDNIAK
ncbi:iron chaperone [Kaarinaea lacus]